MVHLRHFFFHKNLPDIWFCSKFFIMVYCRYVQTEIFTLSKHFFPIDLRFCSKLSLHGPRFCAKLLLWSIADMSRQEISLFPKNFAWATILHKIVILEHCGHIQIENFTFSKQLCLIKDSAKNLSKILIKLVILWCESAREVNNRLTGWAFAHLVNYFTHPVN